MSQVRIAAIARFCEQVIELNGSPEEVLKAAGLSPSYFSDHTSDDMVSYEQMEFLLQVAANITGCPTFSARMGVKQDINFLGVVGFIMQQSSDVRTALKELVQHFKLHVREGAILETEEFGEYATLSFTVTQSYKAIQTSELAMSEAMAVMRSVCGSHWRPIAVNFTHEASGSSSAYTKVFGVPVHFGQDKSQIVFRRDCLDQKIAKADPALNEILQTHIEGLEDSSAYGVVAQVERLIRRNLPTGKCSVDLVAERMSVHRRTLHRMLKEKDTSYKEILESIRKITAQERLKNSNISIIQLSDYLGYRDNSAFTRAFSRWFGIGPQAWRKENQ